MALSPHWFQATQGYLMKEFPVFCITEDTKPYTKQLKPWPVIQHNKLLHLEDSMVMYGIYNEETLDQLINTVHHIHNTTMSNVKLFAGQ